MADDPLKLPESYQDNTDSTSEELSTDSAASAAAKRVKSAVQPEGGRQVGPISIATMALGATPLVWGHMVGHVVNKAINYKNQ